MDHAADALEAILKNCAAAVPEPLYPADFAQATGIPRDQLDALLDKLRTLGLVRLTDWVQGRGQGYTLTPEGTRVVHNTREMEQLKNGRLKPVRSPSRPAEAWAERGTAWDRGEAVRDALLYYSTPTVTITLILLNVLVFIAGLVVAVRQNVAVSDYFGLGAPQRGLNQLFLIHMSPEVLKIIHACGAITGGDIVQGQWWRLLSSCFVHIGLVHLVVNMYTFYVIGPLLEHIWGRWRFLVLYLISGLAGSCAMVIANPESLGAGASGALWGLITALAAWVFLNRNYMPTGMASGWLRRLAVVIVLNASISLFPGISAAAHFGGGIVGLVVAWLLNEQRFAHGLRRWLAALGLAAIPVISVAAVVRSEATDPRWELVEFRSGLIPRLDTVGREYTELLQKKWQPLDKQRSAKATPELAAQAVETGAELRAVLNRALALTEAAGPYRDANLEELRQGRESDFKSVSAILEKNEWENFVLPVERDAERIAYRTEKQLSLLLAQPVAAWMDEEVQELTERAEQAKTMLEQVIDVLKRAGPYENRKREELRQLSLTRAEAESKLLGFIFNVLHKRQKLTAEEERELQRLEKAVQDLRDSPLQAPVGSVPALQRLEKAVQDLRARDRT
jgi:membrane associated rhomboid family serine protease